jgi:hypothetical protein
LVPTAGNNDDIDGSNTLFPKYFGYTENGRDIFYTFNWSTTQFIICQIGNRGHVDPNNPRNFANYQWINETLANGQDKDYRILIYHINNFGIMAPIVEKYNVSLAIFGHSHQYERSYYRNHTYLCLGNGATIQGTMIEPDPYVQANTNGVGFTQLKIDTDGIRIETYTPTFDLMDSVLLQRLSSTSTNLVPDNIITHVGGN